MSKLRNVIHTAGSVVLAIIKFPFWSLGWMAGQVYLGWSDIRYGYADSTDNTDGYSTTYTVPFSTYTVPFDTITGAAMADSTVNIPSMRIHEDDQKPLAGSDELILPQRVSTRT